MQVLIISGPIASGKTTIGKKLYERLFPNSEFIDIDDLISTIDPDDSYEDETSREPAWHLAKEQISQMCKQAFDNGKQYFIIAAPFFTSGEVMQLKAFFDIDYPLKHFFLVASLPVRIKRMERRSHKNTIEEMEIQENKIEIASKDQSMILINSQKPIEMVVDNILSLI